jgi:glycosyltransferase involved in cell wall biosynthesis
MTVAPTRILHVHTLPVISGSGINTLLTMKGSLERGDLPALACESEGRLTDEARRAGIRVFLLPALGREIHAYKDISAVVELARLMRQEHFEIIHTHNSKAGFVGRLAGRFARVPTVVHTVHGFAFHDAESTLRRTLFRNLERAAAHWCDGMIFISKPLQIWADRERIGRRVPHRVIYSGIDIQSFKRADSTKVRSELAIASDRLVVGIISKLWEGKGHHLLLQAWRQIQGNWRDGEQPLLAIVGEGPLEIQLRQTVRELGIANSVLFTGFRADIPEVTAAIDIAVLPSAFEGMGRVILEAMAAGKPVVASRVGGIPDLVRDGVNGILVSPNDQQSIADALLRLLTEPNLRRRFSVAAGLSIEEKHSAEYMVREIHAFYEYLRERSHA